METGSSQNPSEIEHAGKLLRDRYTRLTGYDFTDEQQAEEHKIYISEQFLNSLQDQVRRDRRIHNISSTIFRVPLEIRSTHPMAYTPMAVCIGPYFYSERYSINLKQMQDYKWSCARKLVPQGESSHSLLACLAAMKNLESTIRASYSDEINMSSDELAEMMLLDGCFILHLLLKYSEGHIDEDDMEVSGRCWIWNLVTYDLLLLENQIPFIVIIHLFILLNGKYEPENLAEDFLVACACRLFSSIHPSRADAFFANKYHQVHHLLHLFHLSISQYSQRNRSSRNALLYETPYRIPSAEELQYAGVKFKKSKNDSSFLDIKFSKGIMEIPPLEVHNYSNSLFRNLIAFEQCYPNTGFHVTIYAFFMDCLLNTPEDERLLHRTGILTNRMTADKDATQFFSHICNQVHYPSDSSYLRDVCADVSKYQESRFYNWRAILVRQYFSNPWAIISLVGVVVLLLLVAAQTFYTIYPYYHP